MRPSSGMSGTDAAAVYADRMRARKKDHAAAETIEAMLSNWLNYHEPLPLNREDVKALLHAVERLRG